MPCLNNVKHEAYCVALVIEKLDPADAYVKAGYIVKNRERASQLASRLSKSVAVRTRINELCNSNLENTQKTSITSLHAEAVRVIGSLLHSDNDYVAKGAAETILSRSEPIVKQTQSVQVHITDKSKERRVKLLEKYAPKVIEAVVVPGTVQEIDDKKV